MLFTVFQTVLAIKIYADSNWKHNVNICSSSPSVSASVAMNTYYVPSTTALSNTDTHIHTHARTHTKPSTYNDSDMLLRRICSCELFMYFEELMMCAARWMEYSWSVKVLSPACSSTAVECLIQDGGLTVSAFLSSAYARAHRHVRVERGSGREITRRKLRAACIFNSQVVYLSSCWEGKSPHDAGSLGRNYTHIQRMHKENSSR